MNTTVLNPVGVEITDFSIVDVDAETTNTLAALLAEHGVLILRNQVADDDQFIELLKGFGELTFTVGETPVPDHPDLNVISNVGRTTAPRSVFHVDTSYVRSPPAYTALRVVTVPEQGGQTVFSNQYRAFETLPAGLRDRLEGRRIRHVVTGVEPGPEQDHEAWHPAFRPHPVGGRVALYLSTPQRCVAISGVDDAEARDIIAASYEHATAADNTLRHAWAAGDVVMWDNACVMHRADHSGVVGDRVLHRGMVADHFRGGNNPRARAGRGIVSVEVALDPRLSEATSPPAAASVPAGSQATTWFRRTAKTLEALTLIQLMLPANFALTVIALVRGALRRDNRRSDAAPPVHRRTVLLSGGKMTKALTLARAFHRAGHRVILVESAKYRYTGHRFSRCVDRFHIVPPADDPKYGQALRDIVVAEGADLYVPVSSPSASYYDALAATLLAPHCTVLHADADTVHRLDDKYELTVLAASLGLPVPDTYRITAPDQVSDFDFDAGASPYILKSIVYDPVNRLDLTQLPLESAARTADIAASKPISDTNPWILQSFVEGREYCTHATVLDGRLLVYVCCPSSTFQVNYASVDKPAIEAWVRAFVEPLAFTGQISFDFIETADGRVFPIECNPRTHSAITMLGDHPDLAAAYLGDDVARVCPTAASKPTYWLYHELWRALTRPAQIADRVRTVTRGTDAIFDWDDPLPFLLLHHLQIPVLLIKKLLAGEDWIRIDFNIGKLVEAAGD